MTFCLRNQDLLFKTFCLLVLFLPVDSDIIIDVNGFGQHLWKILFAYKKFCDYESGVEQMVAVFR